MSSVELRHIAEIKRQASTVNQFGQRTGTGAVTLVQVPCRAWRSTRQADATTVESNSSLERTDVLRVMFRSGDVPGRGYLLRILDRLGRELHGEHRVERTILRGLDHVEAVLERTS